MNIDELVPKLEAETWPCYVVDADGLISYANAAWDRVAAAADGPSAADVIHTRWLAHIAGAELVAFYRELFDRVMDRRAGERHLGDCNTPDRFRLYSNRFDPLPVRGQPRATGMVVVTSEIENRPIGERYPIGPPDDDRYRQPSGFLLQCGGCRRMLVAGSKPRVWELVPEMIAARRADVTHGICELCREVHYGALERRS